MNQISAFFSKYLLDYINISIRSLHYLKFLANIEINVFYFQKVTRYLVIFLKNLVCYHTFKNFKIKPFIEQVLD